MTKFDWNLQTRNARAQKELSAKERDRWMTEKLVNKSRVNIAAMKNRAKKSSVVAKIHWVKDTPASKAIEFMEWQARNDAKR